MDLVHLAATNPSTNLPQKLVTNPSTGALVVDAKATISTDLSVIEGQLGTIASDLAVGIIAGVPSVNMNDGAGNALTSTAISGGHQALDVNIVGGSGGGGGGGGGGASAAYNSTLPTYTSGASSTLQTDVNGKLLIQGGNSAAVSASLASLPSLAAGSAIIGRVGIDQTTPGTTNAVSVGSSISSLPLPTNAAKETGGNLDTIVTKETAIAAAAGTTADSAWSSGAGTLVALGKAIVNALTAALPGGTNKIGGVTIADGDNSSQGAKADSAANNSTSSWSIIALLKGIYALCAAATPAGTNNIGTVGVVNGSNTLAIDSNGFPTVNTPVTTANYNQSGVITQNTILVGPINCSQYRTMAVQVVSIGTTGQITAEISNDNSTWTITPWQVTTANPTSAGSTFGSAGIYAFQTWGATYFRLRLSTATTAGATTLYVQGVKEVYPNNLQTVLISGTPAVSGTLSGPAPSATQGFVSYHTLVSAATTNATSVKASSGNIGSLYLTNTTASTKFFKIFNKASAPTVGTDTPVLQVPIPPSTSINFETSYAGLRLSTGIAYAITGAAALLDNTAVSAGDVLVNMTYV